MDKLICMKCGSIEVGVKERYENRKMKKLKLRNTDQVINHIVSEDVIYECFCDKCQNFFEVSGERREYGEYTNDVVYEII